jgi:hypothetical protein
MDEFMAILELMELARTRQYDVIIMDTAPTGHTIRLLELPGLLQQWVSILDLMMKKHRFMAETFSRSRYPTSWPSMRTPTAVAMQSCSQTENADRLDACPRGDSRPTFALRAPHRSMLQCPHHVPKSLEFAKLLIVLGRKRCRGLLGKSGRWSSFRGYGDRNRLWGRLPPPAYAEFLRLLHGTDQQANLNAQQLHVAELNPNITGNHQSGVQNPL